MCFKRLVNIWLYWLRTSCNSWVCETFSETIRQTQKCLWSFPPTPFLCLMKLYVCFIVDGPLIHQRLKEGLSYWTKDTRTNVCIISSSDSWLWCVYIQFPFFFTTESKSINTIQSLNPIYITKEQGFLMRIPISLNTPANETTVFASWVPGVHSTCSTSLSLLMEKNKHGFYSV